MVNTGESETVEVEDIVAVVKVGNAEIDFEDGAFANGEFALAADVESVVCRQASGIELAVSDTVLAVGACVVGEESIREGDILVHSLGLCEGESATETPTSADFPLVLFSQTDSGEEIDSVASVVVGGIGLYLVGAVYPSEGVGCP